ncbi:uncharacterized protein [Musca autumnalis]|uniref:uncharacterized protein n=1 Tax=Musca autumnalis TaxID=221902 RepID=UPI003CF54D0F
MNKIIFILIGSILLSQVFADDDHDWFPENPTTIQDECEKLNPLTDESKAALIKGTVHERPDFIGYMICTAKGMNFYTTEKGFDTDRLLYVLEKMNRLHNRNAVAECVKKHKDVKLEYTMVYNVAKCMKEVNKKEESVETENSI